jgi:hypothetical protein
MLLTRRKLYSLGLGIIGGALAASTTYSWYFGEPENVIIAVLNRRLKLLNINTASFKEFSTEYIKYREEYRQQLKILAIFAQPLQVHSPYKLLPQGSDFHRLEDNIVSMYLMSTDFFQNGADTKKQIQYLSFYDPYVSVCRNPFLNQG